MPSDGLVPRPPDKLRPGQLGVVMLGRVIIGDVAVTLVDLAIRQFLAVQEQGDRHEPEGVETGWSLAAVQSAGLAHRRESLLGYERTLLDAVAGSSQATTSSLAPRMTQILADTRREILHDAVHRGWLRHIHHDQRTAEGEQLAARIRTFQNGLPALRYQPGRGRPGWPAAPVCDALRTGPRRRPAARPFCTPLGARILGPAGMASGISEGARPAQ